MTWLTFVILITSLVPKEACLFSMCMYSHSSHCSCQRVTKKNWLMNGFSLSLTLESAGAHNEKERRSATWPHISLNIQVLPTPDMLLNLARMNLDSHNQDSRASGACTILLTAVVPQSNLDCQLERSEKCSARLTKRGSMKRFDLGYKATTWLTAGYVYVSRFCCTLSISTPAREASFEGLIHASDRRKWAQTSHLTLLV